MKAYKHHWLAMCAGPILALAASTAGADAPQTWPASGSQQVAQSDNPHRHGAPGKGVIHRHDMGSTAGQMAPARSHTSTTTHHK